MTNFNIIEQRENTLLKRKELKISIPHNRAPTPSKAVIQKAVADKESVPATHVFVDRILSGVGKAECVAFIDVYQTPVAEDLSKPKEKPAEEAAPEKKGE